MNKSEMAAAVAEEAGLSKADGARALDAVLSTITKSLKKGEKVTLVGFGSFDVANRKARNGRNPQTGEVIKIKAAKVPRFKAGAKLKAFQA